MHLVVYIASPWAGVPEPGGNPAPSGPMLTSAASTWAGVAGTPSPGPFGAGLRAGAGGVGFALSRLCGWTVQ